MEFETRHLPEVLLTEMLLRLPVKSLVRFKGVCKFWESLISDPRFARSHFELAAPRLLFCTYDSILTMDLDGWLHSDPFSEVINNDFLPKHSHIVIEGSCRGFLLLECNKNLYLWNPSTHVHKPIPSSPVDTNVHPYPLGFQCLIPHVYGFGYDPSKDDYLVVKVSILPSSSIRYSTLQFFSLRANMWKYIEFTHLSHLNLSSDPRPRLLFNEAIHWLAYDRDKSMNAIIAFDLMEKRLLEIPQPDNIAHDLSYCYLWVQGRFLSLAVKGSDTIDILVMEKCKVQSSWTKTLVLSLSGLRYKDLCPVCSTKSGDIVMDDGKKLVKYTDKGEQLEHCEYWGYRESQVPMYTESILSLPGEAELKKMKDKN